MSAPAVSLWLMDRDVVKMANTLMSRVHYLRKPIDPRCSIEGYSVHLGAEAEGDPIGFLLVGRPQAQRCGDWYGDVEDVATGRCEVTRWQVLNLARVWFDPAVQPSGALHHPEVIPGFVDRKGVFRSTLATAAIALMRDRVVRDYLVRRPPCFLDEPFELRWLLSYCDRRVHRGALYHASDAQLYRTNKDRVQTWRWPLRPLTSAEDAEVREAATASLRSQSYRARRAQTELVLHG